VVVAYWVTGFTATRGTMHSALDGVRSRPLEYRDGAWQQSGRAPVRARFRFPAPVGEQAVTLYPSGEVLTVPRHTETRSVRSLFALGSLMPLGPLAGVLPLALPAAALALHTPIKPLLDLAVDRLPEGPSEDARRRARFVVAALARGEDGLDGRCEVRGSDVYGLTAVIAVHAATLLADPAFDRAGTLAPAEAFDPVEFLNYLGDHGVSFRVDAPAREPAA
jgi:short subunit dehydrogenase-like uncharacterized protein